MNKKDNLKSSKAKLVKVLIKYNRIYYITIFINFLVLFSIFSEFIFILFIENGYKFAFISLITSAVLASIAFYLKFHWNSIVSELLMYLMEKEESIKDNISTGLKQMSSIFSLLIEKSGENNDKLLTLLQLFDYTKKEFDEIKPIEEDKKEKSNIEKVINDK